MKSYGKAGHHDGDHAHQLYKDVERRAGGILEGIADGVSHDCGVVTFGVLASEVTFLDILLGTNWMANT